MHGKEGLNQGGSARPGEKIESRIKGRELEDRGGGWLIIHLCQLLSLGVPLVHIVRNTMVLEEPSSASQHKSEEVHV